MRRTSKTAAIVLLSGASLAMPVFAQWDSSYPPAQSYVPPPSWTPQQQYAPHQAYAAPPQYGPQQYQQPYNQQPPQQQQLLSPQQLDNLVAPIALYPDPLLGQVLAASTYPMEIQQAAEWVRQRPGMSPAQLLDAARQMNWDPTVQALVAFPDVLALLTRDPQWTTDLGNAFLAQQDGVMNAIQQMRSVAQQNGQLRSTPQQIVSAQPGAGYGPAPIQIQPADPQVMYVPYYNPAVVFGPPVYGVYPPLGYPAGLGILFGAATLIGSLFTGFLTWGGWGWGLNWLAHGLFLNGLFLGHFGFGGGAYRGAVFARGYSAPVAWTHNPVHRLGVPYSSASVAGRFGGTFNGYRGASSFRPATPAFSARSYASTGFRSPGYSSSYNYRPAAPSYSRPYATPAMPQRSSGYSSPSLRGTMSGSFTPQYSARSSLPSGGFGSYGPARAFSGGAQHFSAPKSSGNAGGSHFSAPHFSGGGHASGGHSSGGHSGGHHR
ncbi:MAG TPA: DUF3300 domain-containing protein [Bryobacteraceae bacterium]|nr:DUF3300 domain-containing protein [Bryobacteraceae bacterium]